MKVSEIFNKIISLFSKTDLSNEIEKDTFIPKYEVGDVVYSVMPLSDEALEEISPSHRVRPFLIVDIDYENGVYKSFSFTSQVKKKRWESALVYYKNGNEKVSCVVLRNLWNLEDKFIKNYVYKMDDENSINVVKKVLTSNKEKLLNTEFVKKYKDKVRPETGDIIQIGSLQYYIYELLGNSFNLFPVYDSVFDENVNDCFYINGKYIDFSKSEIMNLEANDYSFKKIMYDDSILMIEDACRNYRDKQYLREQGKDYYFDLSNSDVLEMGSRVWFNSSDCVYLYTDDVLGKNYFVNLDTICDSFNFLIEGNVSDHYEIVGKMSDKDLLGVLRFVGVSANFLPDERVKKEIIEVCKKR